ncbi:MAG: hypothetical protein DMG11_17275 [Acidobacteria bacterium]|nr:MAG: hypothetical protein DMG11_17275 [Acidobacteriota bacterium]
MLYLVFRLVMPSGGYARRPFLEIGGEAIVIPTVETLKRLTLPVAVVFGFFFGLTFSSDWNIYTLFVNRVSTVSVSDPIFQRPISFYLFTLPVLENVTAWFLSICVIGLLASILLSVIDMTAAFRGVSLGVSLLLLAMAAQTYVSRYTLILTENNLFTGIRYVDDKIVVPGLWFVIAALIMGAAVAAANIRLARIRNIGVAVAIPALTYLVAGILAPGYVTNFVVRPNELVRETPEKGVRPRPHRRGSFRTAPYKRCVRSGRPCGHTRQCAALGLAGASVNTASDPGNPKLLRFSRYRRGPLHDRRQDAGDDARGP